MRYVAKNTIFHQLDPRTKIFLSIVCACLIVILNEPLSLFLLFVVILCAFLSIKPPLSYIKIAGYLIFFAFVGTIISQGLFYYFEPKTPLITILPSDFGFLGHITGGIYLYKEGLIYGSVQSMRMFVSILLGFIIVMTTYPSELILGLNKLGVSEKIGFMLMVSIRFLPSLIEEAKRILIAQRLRGLRLKGIRGAFKGLRVLLVPLVIDSLRTARRIALAAEVRGFCGKRNPAKRLQFSLWDRIFFVGILVVLILALKYRFSL